MSFTFLNLVTSNSFPGTVLFNLDRNLGFLICVPMLERWQTEDGIQAIDGWSFQVNITETQTRRILKPPF